MNSVSKPPFKTHDEDLAYLKREMEKGRKHQEIIRELAGLKPEEVREMKTQNPHTHE